MEIKNSPGKHERHVLRRKGNLLFPVDARQITPPQLAKARKQDQDDYNRYIKSFQELVEKAVNLEANTPSETILELKESLDRSYQESCTLPGDNHKIRSALKKLIGSIMQAVWKETGDDPVAQKKLEEEEIARQEHFQLQNNSLVADLTAEESPCSQEELIPTLLSEPIHSLQEALSLFDEEQLMVILHDATLWLAAFDPDHENKSAADNLEMIGQCAQIIQASEHD